MGYIGNQSNNAFSSLPVKQDLTGATGTSLTLTHAVASAEGIDLYINNVRQEPTTAYSAVGTAVTLTGSVVATDDIYVVYNSLALQTTVPPDDSVSTAKIIDGSVTSAKLAAGVQGVAGITSSSTSGTALSIDANNIVTTPTRHCFWWSYSTGAAAAGLTGVINWNVTVQQSGGHTAAADFTCPVAGLYQFNFNAFGGANSSGGNVGGTTDPRLEVSTDGGTSYTTHAIGYTYAVSSDHPRCNICFATVLPANAKVRIRVNTGHIFASNNQNRQITFTGYLVGQEAN